MTLLVALHRISMPDKSRPGQPGTIHDDFPSWPRPHFEKQVMPGVTFDYVGSTAEVARLIDMGAARLPTAAETAAYRPPA